MAKNRFQFKKRNTFVSVKIYLVIEITKQYKVITINKIVILNLPKFFSFLIINKIVNNLVIT